jgi:cytidylate kinase
MYRTVGLHFMRLGLLDNPEAIARMVKDVDIAVRFEGDRQIMLLEGEDVSQIIRTPEASMTASHVSAIPEVREYLVALQRRIAEGTSIIMDGRDIGTKVLPNATLKVFITASAEVRAMRRYTELREKGTEVRFHEVLDDIVERDYKDTHRAASPLERAEDAHLLDTSAMTRKQASEAVIRLLNEAIGG